MNNFYAELSNMFVRPSRQTYNKHDLGSYVLMKGNPIVCEEGQRFDFEVKNSSGCKLVGSFFRNNQEVLSPCVVYLHGFNGSRLECLILN